MRLRGSPNGKAQKRWYLLAVGLDCYKWYQNQTPGDVPARRLSPKGGWTRGGVPARMLAPKGGGLWGPASIGEGNECQRGCWIPKGGGLWDPTSVGEENKAFFIRVWKPLPSRHILKTLRRNPKGKAQREQYLLVVGLHCYSRPFLSWYWIDWNGTV